MVAEEHIVYFDASGAAHQLHNKVLVVGGFIASQEHWLAFEPRWKKVLDAAGVQQFHMSDLVTPSKEYAGWKNVAGKRERFLTEICEIVVDITAFSFIAGVNLDDWNHVNQDYQLEESNLRPYSLAGTSCVDRAQQWCMRKGIQPAQTVYIFEDGDPDCDQLRKRVKKDLGVLIRTGCKKRQKPKKKKVAKEPIIQLQTADLAAWQALNVMRDFEQGMKAWGKLEPWLINALNYVFPRHRYDFQYFSLHDPRELRARPSDIPSLLRLCSEWSVPKRS
jgi:hypothetical protein